MANFPSNPSNGNTHVIGSTIWVYASSTDSWTIQDVNEYAVANLESSLPSNPDQGTLWFDKQTTGRLFIYVDGHWIDASPASFDTVIGGNQIDVVTSGSGADVVIGHSDTSTLDGTYGSTDDLTKIDQITVDANGHVTAVTTGAIGHSDTSTLNGTYGSTADLTKIDTITIDGNGHVTAVATGPIGHSNTSNLNGTYGSTSTGTKIDQITVDANGHITNITTGNVSGGSAGQGNMAVGDLAVGFPTGSTTVHANGSNYAGSSIKFGGTTGSGTWKCISRARAAGGVSAQNGGALANDGLYQRVS
jgi:hypothetical protein